MKSKDIVILEKILKYCEELQDTCEHFGRSYEIFRNNFIYVNACCMCILQIGELCKNISAELREQENHVAWKSWCGIRDVFARQYANIDYEIAWDTVQEDVPELEKQVKDILDRM